MQFSVDVRFGNYGLFGFSDPEPEPDDLPLAAGQVEPLEGSVETSEEGVFVWVLDSSGDWFVDLKVDVGTASPPQSDSRRSEFTVVRRFSIPAASSLAVWTTEWEFVGEIHGTFGPLEAELWMHEPDGPDRREQHWLHLWPADGDAN